MYAKGYGVSQNHIEAHKWFHLAAASSTSKPNRDRAVAARDTEAARMTPAQVREAREARARMEKEIVRRSLFCTFLTKELFGLIFFSLISIFSNRSNTCY